MVQFSLCTLNDMRYNANEFGLKIVEFNFNREDGITVKYDCKDAARPQAFEFDFAVFQDVFDNRIIELKCIRNAMIYEIDKEANYLAYIAEIDEINAQNKDEDLRIVIEPIYANMFVAYGLDI